MQAGDKPLFEIEEVYNGDTEYVEDIYIRTKSGLIKQMPENIYRSESFFDRWLNDGDISIDTTDSEIGKGNFGAVYKGEYHGAPVACKTVTADSSDPWIREGNLFFEVIQMFLIDSVFV